MMIQRKIISTKIIIKKLIFIKMILKREKLCCVCRTGILLLLLSAFVCGCEAQEQENVILIGRGAASDTGPGTGVSVPGAGLESGLEESTPAMIRVYVCGAVECPGVVEIPAHSRIEDALLAAGGFAADAAREAVNLADWVSDGEMLYFPTAEEAAAERETVSDGGLVNINTAEKALLCTLPGIGEARAADIVAYREKHGSFQSCEDIMKVTGIKTSVYEKICDKITVR